jgi:hypothetical protein
MIFFIINESIDESIDEKVLMKVKYINQKHRLRHHHLQLF